MKRTMRIVTCGLMMLMGSAAAVRAEDPSMKKGFEEVGDAIADDAKDAAKKTDEEAKKGWHATERGVGDAMQKTGEGVDTAGEKVRKEGQ
jgi:hypothetical protein